MNSQWAEFLSHWHPLRVQYAMFSDENPMMAPVAALAGQVRKERRPASADNPILALQENVSRQIVSALDQWRLACEAFSERTFLSIYGSAALQSGMGIDPLSTTPLRKAPKSSLHKSFVESRVAQLKSQIGNGGTRVCLVRSGLYIGMSLGGSIDERTFELVRRIRSAADVATRLTLPQFKALIREQYYMLLIDEPRAIAAIPSMLPASAA